MEADLVVHCGDTIAGRFLYTLTLTDIASGWTECVPLVVRESTLVTEAIEALRPLMPFPLRALDTDNGTEFLNETLIQYCRERNIEFTRSRPYRKNDQAWVEQKNGAVVRRLVGYRRLEGWQAAAALSQLYSASRLFVNFFQPLIQARRKNARWCAHPQALPSAANTLPATINVRCDSGRSESEIASDQLSTGSTALAGGDPPDAKPFGCIGRPRRGAQSFHDVAHGRGPSNSPRQTKARALLAITHRPV
jgi:hypothetical protein